MELYSELRYDADPVTVFAMLTDEEFIARKTLAANALRHEVTVVRDGDTVTIDLLRVMPPDVPDFVRRFVGETIDISQTDVWAPAAVDGSRTGRITLGVAGAPVSASGVLSLAPVSTGTVVVIDGAIKASVPLFGGKIEQAVHHGVTEAGKIEQRVGREWLAERS